MDSEDPDSYILGIVFFMFRRHFPYCKRSLDIGLTLFGLPIWLPLLGLAIIAVRLCLGRPVFFRQQRLGLYGRPFAMVKLRTMTTTSNSAGVLFPDAKRLTTLGYILRKYSLDELPELFHVLAGTMSLVGPRPLPIRYLDRYTKEEYRRHNKPPGITGLAQISGRNLLSWEKRLALDIWYVDCWSFILDLRILLFTLYMVITAYGATTVTGGTSKEFRMDD